MSNTDDIEITIEKEDENTRQDTDKIRGDMETRIIVIVKRELSTGLSSLIQKIDASLKGSVAGHFKTLGREFQTELLGQGNAELNSMRHQSEAQRAALQAAHEALQKAEREAQQARYEEQQAQKQVQELRQERDVQAQKARSAEGKMMQLHQLILESGLGSSGPTDEEVQRNFSNLRHSIFQFVKRYCTNHAAKPSDPTYDNLTTEAKDFWAMSVISRALYLHFFKEGRIMFGFASDVNEYFRTSYDYFSKAPSASLDDITEWRVRTCLIGKSLDNDKDRRERQERANESVSAILKKMNTFTTGKTFWGHYADEVKVDLTSICLQAHDLAQTFHCTRTEYRWLQAEVTKLEPDHVKTMGTAGSQSFFNKPESYKIIFGGVIKGGGVHGKLRDETVHLSDTEVLLGPFREPSY